MIKCKHCEYEDTAKDKMKEHCMSVHGLSTKQFRILYKELYTQAEVRDITDNMIDCKLCNEKHILPLGMPSHLRRKHNISVKDYYDQYCRISEEEGLCKTCKKHTAFRGVANGYATYCCSRCANLDPQIQNKIKSTNLSKYGVERYTQSAEHKEKVKQTCLSKYGVDSYMKTADFRARSAASIDNDEVRAKRTNTCLAKYDATNPMKSKVVQDKVKSTNLQKYGAENVYASDYGKQKIKETMLAKYGVVNAYQNEEIKKIIHDKIIAKHGAMGYASKSIQANIQKSFNINNDIFCRENGCIAVADLDMEYASQIVIASNVECLYRRGKKFIYCRDLDIVKSFEQEITEKINSTQSYGEKEIYDYIKSIYSGEVIQRTRKIISPLELDLYIPEKNIAIEFNGDYWHSTNCNTPKNYHLNKTELCQKLGIRLIHIFEYEWKNDQDICKSIIASSLGIFSQRLYARNCTIRQVSPIESVRFLNLNHIQRGIKSSDNYGLYYNDELVQLICLGKSRFKSGDIELLRMCTKLNTQVVGGFSKLLKYQKNCEITSYIDISKFVGNSYFATGFTIISQSKPSYVYIKGDIILNRMYAQKHKLSKLLGDKFDPNKTEQKNMIDAGWLQVYDCGTIKVAYMQ